MTSAAAAAMRNSTNQRLLRSRSLNSCRFLLQEKFDFPRARGMRYPFEPERNHGEDFWKYIEDRDKAINEFVKSLK